MNCYTLYCTAKLIVYEYVEFISINNIQMCNLHENHKNILISYFIVYLLL